MNNYDDPKSDLVACLGYLMAKSPLCQKGTGPSANQFKKVQRRLGSPPEVHLRFFLIGSNKEAGKKRDGGGQPRNEVWRYNFGKANPRKNRDYQQASQEKKMPYRKTNLRQCLQWRHIVLASAWLTADKESAMVIRRKTAIGKRYSFGGKKF